MDFVVTEKGMQALRPLIEKKQVEESWDRINAATARRKLAWGFELMLLALFVLFVVAR